MKKLLLGLIVSSTLLVTGCNDNTQAYEQYVKQHGASTEIYCKDGFLIQEYINHMSDAPTRIVLTHDDNIPTRCGEANIITKETAKTGAFSGGVN